MNKFIIWCVSIVTTVFMASCDSDEDTYSFIGDSLVARWDLQDSFPMLITHNYGLGGSGLSYLQDYAGRLKGDVVIVLSGTNDYRKITSQEVADQYAAEYVDALLDFGAKRIYAISVLPRDFKSDDDRSCGIIMTLNAAIAKQIEAAGEGRIVWLDVYHKFLNDKGKLNLNLSYDGLHLNPAGYEILTTELNHHIL